MESLKPEEMYCLRYDVADDPCKYKGMCSHLLADRLEYLKLAEKADVVVHAGEISHGGFRGICYCLDHSQGMVSGRELEDTEEDSEPEPYDI